MQRKPMAPTGAAIEKQRMLVMQLLTDLKALTSTTTADLLLMAQTRLNPGCVERCNKIFERYAIQHGCPSATEMNSAKGVAWLRKYEKFDCGHKGFNAIFKFMCQCVYTQDLARSEICGAHDDGNTTILQHFLCYLADTIVVPFVVFNDSYFFSGWQEAFKQCGDVFACAHDISSQLLEIVGEL